jgi:hypothetical protein
MRFSRRSSALRAVARALTLTLFLPAASFAQKPSESRRASLDGPHPAIEIENPKPLSRKPRKKDPANPPIQLRYRILPNTSGVTAARLEVWDRPDLLVKIPVKVAKNGEVAWTDTSTPNPSRLDFFLIDPDAPRSCGHNCNDVDAEAPPLTVAGEDVPPSFTSDPVRVRASAETMSLDLDGRFFTSSTKVLLAEPTAKKDVWKAWEFVPTEYIDTTKIHVTVPWSYLVSPRKLVLWPFNLDEVEAAQRNGLPLNGTEQKTPVGGGAQEIIYVANASSPVLTSLEPAQLSADASDRAEAKVVLHGSGFTRASAVLVGRDPLEENVLRYPPLVIAPKYLSSEALEVHIPASQLRFLDFSYSEPGPIRIWVRNAGSGFQISESRDIRILPTAKLPPAPPRGVIFSIAPQPLPLMTADGPPREEITIIGRNFRSNDSIVASADEAEKTKLPTQFVSSTELRVSLPRQLWREHRVSYRFVIVTSQGERATELYEDEATPETESQVTK